MMPMARGASNNLAQPAEGGAVEQGSLSPLGETHGAAQSRRARNPAYRRAHDAIAPFEELARVVILRRRALGLTQQVLADRMGTSYSAVSRLESGQHRTSLATLQRLAGALEFELTLDFQALSDDPDETPGRAESAGERTGPPLTFAARVRLS
jgi:ribosome-binding protein aMBF1 (putative translation factor)